MITIFIRIRIGRGEGGGIMHDDIELHEKKKRRTAVWKLLKETIRLLTVYIVIKVSLGFSALRPPPPPAKLV